LGNVAFDVREKAGFKPLFRRRFTKLTGFWGMLNKQRIISKHFILCNHIGNGDIMGDKDPILRPNEIISALFKKLKK
jgi:hypothetical protein